MRAYLLDSSVWVSLFLENDTLHEEAKEIVEMMDGPIVVPYTVLSETSTVLAYKHSKKQAKCFLEYIEDNNDIIRRENSYEKDTLAFLSTDKKISFADSSIVEMAIKENLILVTFDQQMKSLYQEKEGKKKH